MVVATHARLAGPLMLRVAVKKRRGDFVLDASFESKTPGVIALFGRSGCGKTTLVQFIAGLLDADEGRIDLNGVTLVDTHTGYSLAAQRRRIGYVFQDSRLFPHFSVRRNLLYGYQRSAAADRKINPDDVIGLLGLGTLLERRPHQLSGGEKQRVSLGRALLAQPRLLLMDEPLASLDQARREEVLPYLEQLRDTLALPMIYVSHQFEEVIRLASQVVLLEQGHVVATGGLGEISLHPQLRTIIGQDSVGAVLDGVIVGRDADNQLAQLKVGGNTLQIESSAAIGTQLRLQLLARDLILAVQEPRGLSVRNVLRGTVRGVASDDAGSDVVRIDLGGPIAIARVTHAATLELGLRDELPVWVLVKAVSIRGHSFPAPKRDA